MNGDDAVSSAVSSGTVPSVPSNPKVIRIGRRPILSERWPNTGCRNMKSSSVAAFTCDATCLVKPVVFTRNFCAYVV
ncbi:hypothetical protein D3C83_130960 [compost metagenome]